MGAIRDQLTQELRDEIARKGTVVWLDKDGHYGAFAEELAKQAEEGAFPYPVVPFEGSYLELMLELERHGNGLDPDHLLIHLPGHTEATVRKTPMLELYAAGYRYRKALGTLVREAAAGRVSPEAVDSLVADDALSLDRADAWLEAQLREPTSGIVDTLRRMSLANVVAELLNRESKLVDDEEAVAAVADHMHRTIGLDEEWLERFAPDRTRAAGVDRDRERLHRAVFGWALCAEYAHDFRGETRGELVRFGSLSSPLAKASRGLAETLRQRHPREYEHSAQETEDLFFDDLKAPAEVLGDIDTFPFEEQVIREAAILALKEGHWSRARAWATERRVDQAFWVTQTTESARRLRWTWTIIHAAAALGQAMHDHPSSLQGQEGLREAVERYASELYLVDEAQRRFEHCWHDMRDSEIEHYADLRQAVKEVRGRYREWADDLAAGFNRLCAERGFLPESDLQQRALYDTVIHPLTADGSRVAVFLVDALRFEMAKGLVADLATGGATVDLKPRLAELPTITSVGMNALAPVAQDGKLEVALGKNGFSGFRTGEYTVSLPKDRARAMGSRSAGKPALQLSLEEAAGLPLPDLKKKISRGPNLIVVHSLDIDEAGEAGFGLATFDRTLRQIRSAAHQLQKAGVSKLVITADHGFILRDEDAAVVNYGSKAEAERRHVLTLHRRADPGMVTVSLSELGYRVASEQYLSFREDTATINRHDSFAHGGNSLQERVIPVLVLERKRKLGSSLTSYEVKAEHRKDLMGRRRVRIRLDLAEQKNATFDFTGTREITLALRGERKDVTVHVADIDGPAKLVGSRLRVPVGGDWSDIFFTLEGESEAPARIEVFHPDAAHDVAPARPAEFYAVTARHAVKPSENPPSSDAAPAAENEPDALTADWEAAIDDERHRRVMTHIDQHGSINENDLRQLLSTARAVRKFARRFDALLLLVPFGVRIEAGPGGKTYVKE